MKIENRKKELIEEIEESLPEFVKAVATMGVNKIVLHQDAFAADYQEHEYALLGRAIKYAGLFNKEVYIIGTNRETLQDTLEQKPKPHNYNLTEDDYDRLISCFYVTFEAEISEEQVDKLLTLYPAWDGNMDTDGVSDVMNGVLKTFVDMDIPLFESPKEDKEEWQRRIVDKRPEFLKFISTVPNS